MAPSEMFAVFIALSNDEAHCVCELLVEAGIHARVIEWDSSRYLDDAGPEPEVWIDRAEADRAQPVLDEYLRRGALWRMATWRRPGIEHRQIDRHAALWYAAQAETWASADIAAARESIQVACEECGERSRFPAVLKGRVEDCPHCGAAVDVGDDADFDGPDSHLSDAGEQGTAEP